MSDLPESASGNLNNPSKEIFQSFSGVYDGLQIGLSPYALDIPNSISPNNTSASTSTTPQPASTLPPGNINNGLNNLNLTAGIGFIDDMLIFNPYIHYAGPTLKSFNPQSFLQQSLSDFNAYNFANRTP